MPLPTFSSDSLGAADPATGMPLPQSATTVALLSASLPDLCTVTRHTYTDDEAGGQVPTDTTLGPYACAILTEPKPMDKVMANGVHVEVHARELYIQSNADVLPGDGLEHNGREYVVIDCTISTGDLFQKAYLEWLGQRVA